MEGAEPAKHAPLTKYILEVLVHRLLVVVTLDSVAQLKHDFVLRYKSEADSQ